MQQFLRGRVFQFPARICPIRAIRSNDLLRLHGLRPSPTTVHNVLVRDGLNILADAQARPFVSQGLTIDQFSAVAMAVCGDARRWARSGAAGDAARSAAFKAVPVKTDRKDAQLTLAEGRTLEQKREFYKRVADDLHARLGIRREDIFLSLGGTGRDDWPLRNGEASLMTS